PAATPLLFDVTRYDLDLRFDFERQRVAGVVTVSARVLEDGLRELDLDADAGLRIGAVWLERDGSFPEDPPRALGFHHAEDRLTVLLDRHYGIGETLRVAIAYAGRASRLGDGVTWATLGESTPSATTMAEPFGARVWVPCHDRPDDKALWTLRVTAPAELEVGSNGVRVDRRDNPDGTATTMWASRYPIATYLVVIDISDYRVAEDLYRGLDGTAAMPVQTWAYPWNETRARTMFASTSSLLGLLAAHFGEYPFLDEKYGNCLAPIGASGMEHQTLTSVAGGDGPGDNGVLDWRSVRYLDVHEAAHQWWGDWVSPASWKDLWLNESFASYAELLLAEADGRLQSYMAFDDWRGWFRGPLYDNPEPFSATIYSKGARVLRMLERLMGRERLERALGRWRERFGGGSATTADLEEVLEATWGSDLSWFFEQWVYGTGRPHLRWSWKRAVGPAVRLELEQVQTNAGLFRFPLDVEVRTAAGRELHSVEVEAVRSRTFEIPVDGEPEEVRLDPDHWLLAEQHPASAPDLDFGPAFDGEIVFPPVVTGGAATVRVPVTNLGGSVLEILGSDSTEEGTFGVDLGPDGLALDPGASGELAFRFTPSEVGVAHGWIELDTNDPAGGGVAWVELRGAGVTSEGVAVRATGRVRWTEPVAVGSAAERLITITNAGTEPARVTARIEGAGFSLPGATSMDVAPGEAAPVLVRFAPPGEGSFEGRLHLEPAGGAPVTVALLGYGAAAPRLAVEPGVVLFGIVAPGEERRRVVRVTNRGQAPMTVSAVSVEGHFSVAAPRLPRTLGA
ncbi:MAG TPA: choice-of-anchor D domain-containing protein, partial [Acidobacteria bacterium]|nr:choice-of-anchor D domain-containing protein [Acidobacteriota bacterium]